MSTSRQVDKKAKQEMTVKTVTSGKHPIAVRFTPEEYAKLRLKAAKVNKSVNEYIYDTVAKAEKWNKKE